MLTVRRPKRKRTRSNNNGIRNERTTTGVPAAEVNEATRPGSGDISAETNKATQDESNHAGTEDLGVVPPEDKEEDTSREDDIIQDLLKVPVPKTEFLLRPLVKEILRRANIMKSRNMLNGALKLYIKGCVMMEKYYEREWLVKDNDLCQLYINQAKVRGELHHEPWLIRQNILFGLQYCVDPNEWLKCLSGLLKYYDNVEGETEAQKLFKVRRELADCLIMYTQRMLELQASVALPEDGDTEMEESNVTNVVNGRNDVANGAEGGHTNEGSGAPIGSGVDAGAEAGDTNNFAGELNEEYWAESGTHLLPKDSGCRWSFLEGYLADGSCCDNCLRTQTTQDPENPYFFDMYRVCTSNVKETGGPLRLVKASRSPKTAKLVRLCTQCHNFLGKHTAKNKNQQWKNVWPSFYWNLLSGTDEVTKTHFHQTFGPEKLWKFIPDSLRKYWMRSLQKITFEDSEVYASVTETLPKSHFVDRTLELKQFWADIEEYSFEGMLRALDPQRVKGHEHKQSKIIPDVLCPWGCSEFLFCTSEFDPSLLIQYHLRAAQLNLPSALYKKIHLAETSRLDYLRDLDGGECHDHVLLNEDWPILPTMLVVPGLGPVICTCRHHCNSSKWKRLCPHIPRKPESNNFSSCRPDQLSHCKLQSRMVKPACAGFMNSVPSTNIFTVGYAGADFGSVTYDKAWENTGPKAMSYGHEALSFGGRKDISTLAEILVREGHVSPEMMKDWQEEYNRMKEEGVLEGLTRGSTYTPTANAVQLQIASSEDNKVLVTVKEKLPAGLGSRDVLISMDRSWCSTIYNMQVQDNLGYGWPLKATNLSPKNFKRGTMFVWALLGMISSSKELYHAIDQAVGGHNYSRPAGHLLSFVHNTYMNH